ncbi:MAG: ribonuclease R [Myxococcota bacterium]|jgi:ribonuclease R
MPDFPDAVLAESSVATAGTDDPALTDLRHLPFVTIDEWTSRDLDQALCLEEDGDNVVAWYAIADAAHFVPRTSALFREALNRGASLYAPDGCTPMLPPRLSEGLCSLNPNEDRRAFVWRMVVSPAGDCVASSIVRACIHSRAKLAYDGVQEWFDGVRPDPSEDPAVLVSLRLLPVFGDRRLRNAAERHVVRYRRAEIEFTLDRKARFVAVRDDRNDVERFNEQLSLLCNTEGALALQRADPSNVQPIYRVHEPPPEVRLDRFEAQVAALVRLHDLDPATWGWTREWGPLASWLDGLPVDGVARAIHRQAIMLNNRSTFAATPGPHHGVGAPVYARFSAPMREAVGVYLHGELVEALTGETLPLPPGRDAEGLRTAVLRAAQMGRDNQRTLDREVNRAALDQLLGRRVGTDLPGTVMGVGKGRVYVQLDDPPVDVKVYTRHLASGARPDGLDTALVGADGAVVARLGDRVQVRVVGPDRDSDRWALDLRRA